jgi:hypothetical protein
VLQIFPPPGFYRSLDGSPFGFGEQIINVKEQDVEKVIVPVKPNYCWIIQVRKHHYRLIGKLEPIKIEAKETKIALQLEHDEELPIISKPELPATSAKLLLQAKKGKDIILSLRKT